MSPDVVAVVLTMPRMFFAVQGGRQATWLMSTLDASQQQSVSASWRDCGEFSEGLLLRFLPPL
jgi:hypothetical protein